MSRRFAFESAAEIFMARVRITKHFRPDNRRWSEGGRDLRNCLPVICGQPLDGDLGRLAGLEAANPDGHAGVAGIVDRGLDPEQLDLLALLLGHMIIAGRLGVGLIERTAE
jgi:hypothetical protein